MDLGRFNNAVNFTTATPAIGARFLIRAFPTTSRAWVSTISLSALLPWSRATEHRIGINAPRPRDGARFQFHSLIRNNQIPDY